uniref:Uncharacterized protein n=1 Tax=Candidatus Kentrum eta TaxID=2126337 RepID=A0A450UVT9_9GAMM|nr:MAG: hypothetical protein BECKH772B_GA0070898_1009510 [Candidatus Kentron sp. H]
MHPFGSGFAGLVSYRRNFEQSDQKILVGLLGSGCIGLGRNMGTVTLNYKSAGLNRRAYGMVAASPEMPSSQHHRYRIAHSPSPALLMAGSFVLNRRERVRLHGIAFIRLYFIGPLKV